MSGYFLNFSPTCTTNNYNANTTDYEAPKRSISCHSCRKSIINPCVDNCTPNFYNNYNCLNDRVKLANRTFYNSYSGATGIVLYNQNPEKCRSRCGCGSRCNCLGPETIVNSIWDKNHSRTDVDCQQQQGNNCNCTGRRLSKYNVSNYCPPSSQTHQTRCSWISRVRIPGCKKCSSCCPYCQNNCTCDINVNVNDDSTNLEFLCQWWPNLKSMKFSRPISTEKENDQKEGSQVCEEQEEECTACKFDEIGQDFHCHCHCSDGAFQNQENEEYCSFNDGQKRPEETCPWSNGQDYLQSFNANGQMNGNNDDGLNGENEISEKGDVCPKELPIFEYSGPPKNIRRRMNWALQANSIRTPRECLLSKCCTHLDPLSPPTSLLKSSCADKPKNAGHCSCCPDSCCKSKFPPCYNLYCAGGRLSAD